MHAHARRHAPQTYTHSVFHKQESRVSNEILIHSYTSLTLNSSSFFLCSSRNSLADNDGGVGVTPPPPLPPPPLAAAAEVSRGAGPSRSFNLRGNVRQEEEEKGRAYTADYSREHWTRTCTVLVGDGFCTRGNRF